MIAKRMRVRGRVQGVFYRATTKEEADKLGISGWVKNESDGSVSITAEGDPNKISKFTEWCKGGPIMARVDSLEEVIVDPSGATDFVVKY